MSSFRDDEKEARESSAFPESFLQGLQGCQCLGGIKVTEYVTVGHPNNLIQYEWKWLHFLVGTPHFLRWQCNNQGHGSGLGSHKEEMGRMVESTCLVYTLPEESRLDCPRTTTLSDSSFQSRSQRDSLLMCFVKSVSLETFKKVKWTVRRLGFGPFGGRPRT